MNPPGRIALAPPGFVIVTSRGPALAPPPIVNVAVSRAEMIWLLRWMRPASYPLIALGVGANAYNPIPNRYV